jgi:hypothetical protein
LNKIQWGGGVDLYIYWLRKTKVPFFFSYLSTKNAICILEVNAKRLRDEKSMTSCPVLVNYGTELKY